MWKLENIHPYEVSVSRKRPRKEVRLQVTLEGGYSSRVSGKSITSRIQRRRMMSVSVRPLTSTTRTSVSSCCPASLRLAVYAHSGRKLECSTTENINGSAREKDLAIHVFVRQRETAPRRYDACQLN